MKRPLSLTARISILFAVSAAAILLVAGVLFEHAGNNRFLDHDREELVGKVNLVRNILASARTPQDLEQLPIRLRDVEYGHPGMAILVTGGQGVVYSTGDAAVVKHLADGEEIGRSEPVAWQFGDRIFRIMAAHISLVGSPLQSATVTVALDISADQAFLRGFDEFLWFGIFLIGIALGWLGWVVARQGLAPLGEVSARIAAVSAKALDQPLLATRVPRELEQLVAGFNTMLARLHDSFRRLTNFSDDLAHELRTPINNLLLQTQVTLDGDGNLDDCRTALLANEEECQRLSRMISDMLFLAKADNKLVAPQLEALDLGSEVAALFEFYEALAAEHGVRLEQYGSARVAADRSMLRRVISNLLSNAIRFTPRGMTIRVDIGRFDPDWVRLSISNPGPEIPEELRPRVFERFYRLDPSRQNRERDHVGLGLAIAKSIIELHRGDIDVHCREGQVIFTVRLPEKTSLLLTAEA